jgi:hypothetical protein
VFGKRFEIIKISCNDDLGSYELKNLNHCPENVAKIIISKQTRQITIVTSSKLREWDHLNSVAVKPLEISVMRIETV